MGVWLTPEQQREFLRSLADLKPGEFWQDMKEFCPETVAWIEREERKKAKAAVRAAVRAAAREDAKFNRPVKPKRGTTVADSAQSPTLTRRSTKR